MTGLEHNGRLYDASSPTEHPEGLHRRILNYVRTDVAVPVVVGVAS